MFAGLPKNWSSNKPGSVDGAAVERMFPTSNSQACEMIIGRELIVNIPALSLNLAGREVQVGHPQRV